MVTIYDSKNREVKGEVEAINVELRGLSTDTKPTEVNEREVGNGSTFIEIDTGKIFFCDAENEEWKEV